MKCLQGHLLAASPYMGDSNFAHTVVLLLHHDGDGAFGVVLNRPITRTVEAIWEQVSHQPLKLSHRLNFGGPLQGPLMALHRVEVLSDLEVPPGIFVAAERTHLEKLLKQDTPFRLFIGHAGWGKGQLETELAQGAWLTTPATAEFVFSDDTDLWDTVIKRIGREILFSAVRIKHRPADPSMN